jgi:signal transduction histidine kinase
MTLDTKLLTSVLCHDLRSPICLIRAIVELMRRSGGNSQTSSLDDLEIAAMVMTRIVDNVQIFNRDAIDRHAAVTSIKDISATVRDVGRTIRLLYERQNGEARLDISLPSFEHTHRFALSIEHFQTCVINLLDNSFRYSAPQSPVSVDVSFLSKVMQLSVTNFVPEPISDTSEWVRAGWRSPKNRQRSHGLGLGLHIVHRICTEYGWNLKLLPEKYVVKVIIEIPVL